MDIDQRLLSAALFVRLVDDVVAELRGDDAGDLALLHLEGDLVELGHHHAASEPAERATFLSRRTVGVLLRLLREVRPAADDALADRLDLVERRIVRTLHENVLAEHLMRDDELGLVRLVELRDLVLGRIGDASARLLDELVDLRALLQLLAELHLGDALRVQRLLVVLGTPDLRHDLRNLCVDVRRHQGNVQLLRTIEQELRADCLVESLLLEFRQVPLHLVHRHPVAHVEPDEPVQLELHGIAADLNPIDNRVFHISLRLCVSM